MYPPVVNVPNTDTFEIAMALAELSGFGEGYRHESWRTVYGGNGENGTVCTHVYHRDRNPYAYEAGEDPDITVTALNWDRYLIEYTAKVRGALLNDFEQKLQEFRMRRQPAQTPVACGENVNLNLESN